jgi:DNA-directed RNA polymerase specialized sigma24 family protein
MEQSDFSVFFAALRAGDQDAATQFVRRYEPYLRRVIHMRLVGHRLKRCLDSMDVCQSILAAFFHQVTLGRFVLHSPGKTKRLLATMARNKLISKIRGEHDPVDGLDEGWEPAAPGPTPAEHVADRDLLRAIRYRLSERECWLLDRRAAGDSWVDLAREDGGTPDALRMLHARAVARIRREVHLAL